MMATKQVAQVSGNGFKDANIGFPENVETTVTVLGQDSDFNIPGRNAVVQMVIVGINPEQNPAADSPNWRAVRVNQSSLAQAIGLVTASEWTQARDNGKTWRVIAHRDQPTRDQERDGLRGTMRFKLVK